MVVAMLLSWSIAFAATGSPLFQKGKYYGKQIITHYLNEEVEELDNLTDDCVAYMEKNIETEEQAMDFVRGLFEGVYQGSIDAGFDEDASNQLATAFIEGLIEGIME